MIYGSLHILTGGSCSLLCIYHLDPVVILSAFVILSEAKEPYASTERCFVPSCSTQHDKAMDSQNRHAIREMKFACNCGISCYS